MKSNKFIKFFDDRYNKMVPSFNFGLFRFLIALVMFLEVCQVLQMQDIIFPENIQGIKMAINWTPILWSWLVVIIFISLGLFTRFFAIINYVLAVVVFGTFTNFEYHFDHSMLMFSFLLLIFPFQNSFSIDNLFKKISNHAKKQITPTKKIRKIYYDAVLYILLGLVYFDSIFFKLQSAMWLNGLGVWLPASMPQAIVYNLSFLLNHEWLSKFLGYLTLIFEGSFIFLFWFKPLKWPLILIGMGLHIGILATFPIPYFALGYLAVYILLLPEDFLLNLFSHFKLKNPYIVIYYDLECPLCQRTKIIIEHFDIFKAIFFTGVQTETKHPNIEKIETKILLDKMHAINKKGEIYVGYLAYLKLLWFIPIGIPLAFILSTPIIKQCGNHLYNYIAKNRFRQHCDEENCLIPQPQIDFSSMKILSNLSIGSINKFCFFLFLGFVSVTQMVYTIPNCKSALTKLANKPFLTLYEASETFRSNQENAKINIIKDTKLLPTIKSNKSFLKSFLSLPKVFLGIGHHGVFVDWHFEGIKKIYKITVLNNGIETPLPLYNEKGQPDKSIKGRIWRYLTFSSGMITEDPFVFIVRMQFFIYRFCSQNHLDMQLSEFRIYSKAVSYTKTWQKDYLNQQLQAPWQFEKAYTFNNEIQLFTEK